MNSKSKQNLIVLLTLVALVVATANNAAWAQAPELSGAHPTGWKPHTEEEKKIIEKDWHKVTKVYPNKLGLKRINAERRKKDLPELEEGAMGESPSSVDNSELPSFPTIRDQNEFWSCVSFATTYYQLTHNVGLHMGWENKNEDNTTKFSPKWTYNFINSGSSTNPTSFYSNYVVLEDGGAVTWAEFPFDSDPKGWCLDTNAWRNAISFRTYENEYVWDVYTDGALQQVKDLLSNGYVLTFGTYIHSLQFTTVSDDLSTTEDDPFAGQTVAFWRNGTDGGHAMTFVGYNDHLWVDINSNGVVDTGEKGALKIANSWGPDWGNSGYTWMAYDALKVVSTVPGGPSANRMPGTHGGVYHLPIRPDYTPGLLAEFTINHAKINQLKLKLGIGDAGARKPSAEWGTRAPLSRDGGPYAFDGGTTAIDGTFVLDFTDLMPADFLEHRYFLRLLDDGAGDPLTLLEFKLIDTGTGAEVYSATVPQTVDDNFYRRKETYAYLNYSLSGSGNQAPVAHFSAKPTSGIVPLTVDFDGSGSYDSDGSIVSYSWNFGDGNSATGMSASHTYTASGTFTAVLTVTDNEGAISSDSINITVASDDPDFIAAPSDLDGNVSSGTVTLTWADNSDNEEGFHIERGTKSGKDIIYTPVAQVGVNVMTYSENPGSGRYYYRVQAFNLSTSRVSEYSNTISLRVKNGTVGQSAYESQDQSNQPPVANAGPDQIVECACNTPSGTRVTLNGIGSYDPDGDTLTYTWTGPFAGSPASGSNPTVTLINDGCRGEYEITLVVNGGQADSAPETMRVIVYDTTPPTIHSVSASPNVLWPNDKMVKVIVVVDATDICGPAPVSWILGVTSNEPINKPGDGNIDADWELFTGDPMVVLLRAESAGVGIERLYTIHIKCMDASGNTATAKVGVTVPRE